MTTALLTVLLIVASSTSLTPSQRIERDLGVADRMTSWGTSVAPGTDAITPLATSLGRAGGRGWIGLQATLTHPDGSWSFYQEGPWSQLPFAGRYVLVEGRWPTRPGEVAVTAASGLGSRVSMLSGQAELRVVGRVEDRYATRSSRVLAASGTWAWLPDDLAERFPTESAAPLAYWTGGTDADVIDALAGTSTGGGDPEELGDESTLVRREALLERPARSPIDRYPLLAVFPRWLLPLAVGIVVLLSVRMHLSRMSRLLGLVGVSRTVGQAAAMAATALLTVGATICGAVVGLLLGAIARLILPSVLTQPLGPWEVPYAFFAWCLVVGLAVSVLAAVLGTHQEQVDVVAAMVWRWASRVLTGLTPGVPVAGLVILVFGLRQEPGPESASITVMGAVLLSTVVIPPVLQRATATPAASSFDRLLSSRILSRTRGRALAVAGLVTVSIGLSVGVATVLTSALTADNESTYAKIPEGQVMLSPVNDRGVPAEIRSAFEARADLGDPIEVHLPGNDAFLELRDGSNPVWSADSVGDVERWLSHPLTERQRGVLESGGVLTAEPPAAEQMQLFTPRGRSVPVEAAQVDMAPEWSQRVSGLVLDETAQVLAGGAWRSGFIYTDLTREQSASADAAAHVYGYDSAYVWAFVAPTPGTIPPALSWGTGLLALLGAVVASLSARAVANDLRGQSAALSAVGVPGSFFGRVIAGYVGVPVVTGLALALLSCGAALAALVATMPSTAIVWDPPVTFIVAVVALSVGGAALGAWSATRRTTLSEHLAGE
ncbi:hypothetical protein [Kribbia dieselivorans]|uniref:hypothetical protein n=1 Tax=Kribbia dieselivorans TaxID=331526 RepID=UPI000AA49CFC|nr:hypothetical protein [Kribbia dieselivorans]